MTNNTAEEAQVMQKEVDNLLEQCFGDLVEAAKVKDKDFLGCLLSTMLFNAHTVYFDFLDKDRQLFLSYLSFMCTEMGIIDEVDKPVIH